MPRQARFLEPDLPYHVTKRGNYQQDVFSDVEDRGTYLELLELYTKRYSVEVWAFCLMDNHVHLIVYPHAEGSLAKAIGIAHMTYAQHLNQKAGISGHLWQDRYYSCALDESHLMHAARYTEMNPVRAGLVARPEQWPWSSARHHLGLEPSGLLQNSRWPTPSMLRDWIQILACPEPPAFGEDLSRATKSGRPLGSSEWIKQLEQRTGRSLQAGKRGRPPKK